MLNEFIAFHSRPQEIISDNTKTFQAATKFIEKLRKCEELHVFHVFLHVVLGEGVSMRDLTET